MSWLRAFAVTALLIAGGLVVSGLLSAALIAIVDGLWPRTVGLAAGAVALLAALVTFIARCPRSLPWD